MEIRYLGQSAFRMMSKGAVVVIDPFDPDFTGLKFPRVDADIVLISHDHADHNRSDLVGGNPMILSKPGEYEVKGVEICGMATYHDSGKGSDRGKNTVFAINIEGVNIVHLGDLGHKLDERQSEELLEVDILMIPVGGSFTIDAKEAVSVIGQIEPRVVIPMHYKRPGLDAKFASLSPLDAFLKEMGKDKIIAQEKYIISRDKLPDELQLVVLE